MARRCPSRSCGAACQKLWAGVPASPASGEEAMDKPARRRRAGQPGAKQPEAPPLVILDPVVIADRAGREIAIDNPPFLGDALGTIGAPHPMRAAPPGEAERRVVGEKPRRLDRLGRRKQPNRA